MTLLRVVPALVWTVVVAWLSTPTWSGDATEAWFGPLIRWLLPAAGPAEAAIWHWLLRKTAHVAEYAVLGVLWYWALKPAGRAATWGALSLSAATAALDELHQAATFERGGSALDVGLDVAGAGAAVALARAWTPAFADAAVSLLLWIGAAGGALGLALCWSLAAPAGWLWWTTPLACIGLGVRLRSAHRR